MSSAEALAERLESFVAHTVAQFGQWSDFWQGVENQKKIMVSADGHCAFVENLRPSDELGYHGAWHPKARYFPTFLHDELPDIFANDGTEIMKGYPYGVIAEPAIHALLRARAETYEKSAFGHQLQFPNGAVLLYPAVDLSIKQVNTRHIGGELFVDVG